MVKPSNKFEAAWYEVLSLYETYTMNSIPQSIKVLLYKLAKSFEETLGDNFIGFYLHGSLAMNCFNDQQSDIDFLVVVRDKLCSQTKRELVDHLINSSDQASANGFEMSVIRQAELDTFQYPTPFELHFSNDHLERYLADPNYCCGNDVDPDLAAHLVIIKTRGVCVLGKGIDDVFPEIPRKYYLQSIIQDSEWSFNNIARAPDAGECDVPLYAVLNFCRVLAYIQDSLITSKREGGQWGIKNLPPKYNPLIQQALNKYEFGIAVTVSASLLMEFANYTMSIFQNVPKVGQKGEK